MVRPWRYYLQHVQNQNSPLSLRINVQFPSNFIFTLTFYSCKCSCSPSQIAFQPLVSSQYRDITNNITITVLQSPFGASLRTLPARKLPWRRETLKARRVFRLSDKTRANSRGMLVRGATRHCPTAACSSHLDMFASSRKRSKNARTKRPRHERIRATKMKYNTNAFLLH